MLHPCIINLTKQLEHLRKFLFFSREIWFLKQNTFHLENIIPVSRGSRRLYLAIYSIELFHVAKNGIVLSREIMRSLKNWFLGQGRFTFCPSKSSRVTPFYAFLIVTKIIEVGNFLFLQSNPCIRCTWWVHEYFIDKFQRIQQKRFSIICGTYQHDIILLLTTIFQTLADGLRINVQINAIVFQDFLGTQKPFSIAIFNTGSISILIKNFDTWFRTAFHNCRCILYFPFCANKFT